jgi:tetratricopeptide (TPR) repeat protein
MKQEINYTEFIERYIQGEMNPEEKNWFEKEIEGNLSLKDEINLRKQVNSVLSDKDMLDLKMQLDQIHQEIFEVTEKGKGAIRQIYRRVYITASALAIFAIAFTAYMSNRNFSNDKLVELYYQPAQTTMNFRSSESTNNALAQAMKFYDSKDYLEAIKLFEKILEKDQSQIGVNLYSGISYMEMKQFEKAENSFQKVIDNQPNPFVESANWYIGMCYVMADKREKAASQFEKLSKVDGFYQKDAKKILKRIK